MNDSLRLAEKGVMKERPCPKDVELRVFARLCSNRVASELWERPGPGPGVVTRRGEL